MNNRTFIPSFTFLSLCILFATTVSCEEFDCTLEENKWSWGRYYLYSTKEETISDLVKKDPEWMEAASEISRFASLIGDRRKTDKTLRCLKHDKLGVEEEIPIARSKLQVWNFGNISQCLSDMEWNQNERRTESQVASKITNRLKIFDKKLLSSQVSEALGKYTGENVQDWSKLSSISVFETDGAFSLRKCQVRKLLLFRKKGSEEWAVDAAFTNTDSSIELPNYERWYGGEFLGFNGTEVDKSIERSLEKACDREGNIRPTSSGTFSAEVWEGKPGTHALITEKTTDNRAIQSALDRSALRAEIIAESRLASAIAVLFLPSVLALFPVSLFQEVNLSTVIVYSVMTDVLSIVPIVVKGIELVYFASQKHYSIYTRFYGEQSENSAAISLNWIAYCQFKSVVMIQGVLFVVVGLGMMTVGLLLEVYSSKRLSHLKSRWYEDNADDPYANMHDNAGLLWHWRNSSSTERLLEPDLE